MLFIFLDDSSEGGGKSSKFHNMPKHHVQTSGINHDRICYLSFIYIQGKFRGLIFINICMLFIFLDDTANGSVKCQKVEQEKEHEELSSKINEALNRARSFKSENPCFTIVMKSSYLYSYSLVSL
jgi:hypothetical protein